MPFVIAGTELLIPVLLLIPATRAAGVGVVVLFHLGMSLSPSSTAVDFTIVLFALVFLFLPTQAGVHLTGRAGGRLVTWHELRRELFGDPEASIRYERSGEVVEHTQALEDPELVSRHPVSHRFIAHRIVDPERARCLW